MGINLVTFYNSTVTPQDDALIYENALPGSGMIYGGNVTIKNANTLHVTAGHGALCGRKFTIEETDVPVQLTSSGTLNGRLYIHMDLSNVDEPITLEVERASTLTPPVQQSNVNITDGIYEIDLATFQISTSTISNLVYVAPFIHYEFLKEVIIAPVEKTNVASQNYVVGRHLMLNNILYKVTAAITAGQTIAVGTNVAVSDDVEKQIETNLSSINTINNYKLNQTVIATRQANLTASKAYVVGEQFIYNNTLYEVTAAISKNAAITIGGNCKAADNISTQIRNLNKLLWTNPNSGSAMGAGTITLNDNIQNYRMLRIQFKVDYNHNYYVNAFVTVGDTYTQAIRVTSMNIEGTLLYYRGVGISTGKSLSIESGFYVAGLNSTPASFNGALVPTSVWGMK